MAACYSAATSRSMERELTALPTRDAHAADPRACSGRRGPRTRRCRSWSRRCRRVSRAATGSSTCRPSGSANLLDQLLARRGQLLCSRRAPVASASDIDGLRFTLASGDVIHYRPSGNAPELRCYTEASTAERADELLAWGLKAAEAVVRTRQIMIPALPELDRAWSLLGRGDAVQARDVGGGNPRALPGQRLGAGLPRDGQLAGRGDMALSIAEMRAGARSGAGSRGDPAQSRDAADPRRAATLTPPRSSARRCGSSRTIQSPSRV